MLAVAEILLAECINLVTAINFILSFSCSLLCHIGCIVSTCKQMSATNSIVNVERV